jgi:DNA-directed RNA polymerase specialized sigma24 family protein
MVEHDRLDHVISQVAARDRAAFRRLYAFMAMQIWRIVAQAPLGPADAVAVTRSTFVEVWHSARAAIHYDARDWMATVTTRRVNDRLRLVDANRRHRVHPAEPGVGADRRHQPPTVVDHDAHVHRELTALLGAGAATIRTGPRVFARIDDLDQALATIAATRAARPDPR